VIEIEKVGVVGCGLMGSGIAEVCARSGYDVIVEDLSDEILKKMNRGYTVEKYRRLVGQIRNRIPGVAISTDVIVGFPTESESQFRETYDLICSTNFDTVHIAAYSPRPGTAADRELPDDISAAEKKARRNTLEHLQERIQTEINGQLLGNTIEILVENRIKDKWYGRTRTDKPVFFSSDHDYKGQLVNIRIEKTSPWSLQGTVQ